MEKHPQGGRPEVDLILLSQNTHHGTKVLVLYQEDQGTFNPSHKQACDGLVIELTIFAR